MKLVLSPETTYLMEPQLPDGRIDYLAAINKQLLAQTPPEKNLIVGVFSLIGGEKEWSLWLNSDRQLQMQEYRKQFWEMLGAEMPPMDSFGEITLIMLEPSALIKDYEKELLEFYSKEELAQMIEKFDAETTPYPYRHIVYNQWHETLRQPWTAKEYPYIAAWLARTDEVTAKLIEICRNRTSYYHPLVSDIPLFYDVPLPYVQSLRTVARHFQCRGNWEFAQGNIDEAMECAFSSVRLGQTLRKGSWSIVEDLVGIACTGIGNYQVTTYLTELPEEKDAAWILQKKKEYDAIEAEIGPLPWVPIWCLTERLGTLSAVQLIAVEPNVAHEWFKPPCIEEEIFAKYEKLFHSGVEYDWNKVMKRLNDFYDDWEDTYWLSSWPRRFQASARLERRANEFRNTDLDGTPERQAADFMLGNFMSSIEGIMYALARAEWDRRVTSVAFALAAYRADHNGESPDSLEQLVPKYLDAVPDSPFTEKPLRYLKRAKDVLITNDDHYKLDGSEPEVEVQIAEEKSGGRVYPSPRHFLFIVSKTK